MGWGLVVGHLITVMVCHSQHMTGIMIKVQETVLRSTVQDGGSMTATVLTWTDHTTTMDTWNVGTDSPPLSSVVKWSFVPETNTSNNIILTSSVWTRNLRNTYNSLGHEHSLDCKHDWCYNNNIHFKFKSHHYTWWDEDVFSGWRKIQCIINYKENIFTSHGTV